MDDSLIEQIQNDIMQLGRQFQELSTKRIGKQDIIPRSIQQTHITGNIIFTGLDKDRPTNGNTEVQCYFSTDINKLWIWNGAAWKGITLT